jgi:Double zinc ribbon
MTSSPIPVTCPACGAAATGRFCSSCGASLAPRQCGLCRATLSPQARFCHRCGRAVAGASPAIRSHRNAWIFAGVLSVLLVAAITYRVSSAAPRAVVPDMANAGGQSASDQGGGGDLLNPPLAGAAPDISAMTPRERFDRLFNRIMQASERHDSLEVRRFTPMALGAYDQLDTYDADARYHAAVLHLEVGDFAPAYALADTILQRSPGHLFGYIIRATAAGLQGDRARASRAEREFLAHYDQEMAADRPEYAEHKPAIEEFRSTAKGSSK